MKSASLLLMAVSAAPLASGWVLPRPASALFRFRTPSLPSPTTCFMSSSADKNDATTAIKHALETTKKFGATSYKARLAWELVEKMEYSFQSESSIEETDAELDLAAEGADTTVTMVDILDGDEAYSYDMVENNLSDLKLLLDEEVAKIKHMKDLTKRIKKVKRPTAPIREKRSIEAIAAARYATREFGMHSIQTIQAWDTFEDIASDAMNIQTIQAWDLDMFEEIIVADDLSP